ncbi:hypothetical protein PQR01_00345 [Paraburkholderia rhynchosiae]|uniref:Uncharacterized protein n=1 Tax=Paraburkholderia rhynchosiae TaxID=487049 RepID=A0ACC7N5L1_9BURK
MHRVVSTSKRGRQLTGAKRGRIGRSRYMPHQGEKERERAARCYMERYFLTNSQIQTDLLRLRAAPVVQIISKRDFYAGAF